MAYVPPSRRAGFVPAPLAPKTHMSSGEVIDVFKTRGWDHKNGALYFDGNGGSKHPHLHLVTASGRDAVLPKLNRDVRIAVTMLAWSDGRQGQRGGGGKTFISNQGNTVDANWQNLAGQCGMNGNMQREFLWIMDYFTQG